MAGSAAGPRGVCFSIEGILGRDTLTRSSVQYHQVVSSHSKRTCPFAEAMMARGQPRFPAWRAAVPFQLNVKCKDTRQWNHRSLHTVGSSAGRGRGVAQAAGEEGEEQPQHSCSECRRFFVSFSAFPGQRQGVLCLGSRCAAQEGRERGAAQAGIAHRYL